MQKEYFAVGDEVIVSKLEPRAYPRVYSNPMIAEIPEGEVAIVTAVRDVPPDMRSSALSEQWVDLILPNGKTDRSVSTFWLSRAEETTRSKIKRENARKTAEALISAFSWHDTPQGTEYWDNVYDNLRKIAEGSKEIVPNKPLK